VHALRDERELEHVLGHEVVGPDDADATLRGLDRDAPPDVDVRLKVHDVGLEGVEDPTALRMNQPRQGVTEPVVRVPAPALDAVHEERLSLVLFGPGAVLGRGGRREDLHLVAAGGQAGGETLGELRGTIDVRGEGVAGDKDLDRLFRTRSHRGRT